MAINLGHRSRQILQYVGFFVLGLITFVFALQATFPFNRIKDKIIDALSEKYDITIGGVERGFMPGKLTFTAVSLRTRPAKSDDPITTFYIERLEVNVGIMAAIRGGLGALSHGTFDTWSADIDAKIGAGSLRGNIAHTPGGLHLDFDGHELPGGSLPFRDVLGLPIIGKLEVGIELDLPTVEKAKGGKLGSDWSKADGSFDFSCPTGCTFGDGKTKLKPKIKNARNAAFAADGIDFGTVNLDTLFARVEIKEGKLEVTRWEAKSADGELHIELAIGLQQEINDSSVTGCLRFKGSDELLKREPKTFAAIQTTGAPLAPDGLFHIRLDGKLRDVKRLGQVCGAGTTQSPGEGEPHTTTNRRPNLTPQSDPPVITVEPRPGGIPPPPNWAAQQQTPPPAPTPPPPPPSAPVDEKREAPGSGSAAAGSSEGSAEGSGSAATGDTHPQ